jgi:uncharacterized protein
MVRKFGSPRGANAIYRAARLTRPWLFLRSMRSSWHSPPVIPPESSRFRLRIRRSPIQGFGVFAQQNIPARQRVIEYTGKLFSAPNLEIRLRAIYKRRGRWPRYIFRLNRYWYVDGEIGGSGAERINHCCDPNLVVRKRHGHIFYFSRRRISVGEELTIDYRYRPRVSPKPCRCGSPKCRGTINFYKRRN